MMFVFRRIAHEGGLLLAIADKEVIGKTFEKDDVSVTVSPDFYGTEECSEAQALALIREAASVNAMGRCIVSFMVEHGLVDKTAVLRVGELHHAQLFVLR